MTRPPTQLVETLAATLVNQGRVLRGRLPKAAAGDDDSVHRARVASRRLREVLGVLEASDSLDVDDLRRDVRRVTRALGPVRELDVAIVELQRAARCHGWSEERAMALQAHLSTERQARRSKMTDRLARIDRDLLKRHGARVNKALVVMSVEDVERALSVRLLDRAQSALEALRSCGTLYAPDRLHELRIAVKKLRYALEVETAAAVCDSRPAIADLHKAQRQLGRLHDIQILIAAVQTAGSRRSTLAAHASAAADDLERDCRKLHARILRSLPVLETTILAIRRRVAMMGSGRVKMARATMPRRALRLVSATKSRL